VLSSGTRLKILKILKVLERTPRNVRQISSEIRTSYENTRKHLDRLLSIGVVRKGGGVLPPDRQRRPPGVEVLPGAGGMEAIIRNLGTFSSIRFTLTDADPGAKLEAVKGTVSEEFFGRHPLVILLGGAEDGKVFPLQRGTVAVGRVDRDAADRYDPEHDIVLGEEYGAVTRVSKPRQDLPEGRRLVRRRLREHRRNLPERCTAGAEQAAGAARRRPYRARERGDGRAPALRHAEAAAGRGGRRSLNRQIRASGSAYPDGVIDMVRRGVLMMLLVLVCLLSPVQAAVRTAGAGIGGDLSFQPAVDSAQDGDTAAVSGGIAAGLELRPRSGCDPPRHQAPTTSSSPTAERRRSPTGAWARSSRKAAKRAWSDSHSPAPHRNRSHNRSHRSSSAESMRGLISTSSAILNEQPALPSQRRPGLEALDPIIAKCLAKDAAERCQSATELKAALRAALATSAASGATETSTGS